MKPLYKQIHRNRINKIRRLLKKAAEVQSSYQFESN